MEVKISEDTFFANDKEVYYMPSVEMIEYERASYIKEMEDYLFNLKRMKKSEARKISHDNLVKSQIIKENGEFTERYEFTK